MREARTIGRTNSIDGTHIGLPVEELAGLAAVHPLSFPVLIQPFFPELGDGHAKVRSNSFQILEGEGRRHLAATVGAGKTVHFIPNLFFNLHSHCIQQLRRIVFQFGQKPAKPRSVLYYVLIMFSPVVRHIEVPEIKGIVAMFG